MFTEKLHTAPRAAHWGFGFLNLCVHGPLQKLKKTGSALHEAAGGLKGDQTMCKGIRLFCKEHNSEVSSRGRRKTPLGSTCHFSLLFQVSRAPATAFQSGLFCLFDVLDQRERPAEEVPASTGRPGSQRYDPACCWAPKAKPQPIPSPDESSQGCLQPKIKPAGASSQLSAPACSWSAAGMILQLLQVFIRSLSALMPGSHC